MTRILFFTDQHSFYLTEQAKPAHQLVDEINAGCCSFDLSGLATPRQPGHWVSFCHGGMVLVTWALDPGYAGQNAQQYAPALTGREKQVLQALAQGLTQKAMANRLGIKRRTIQYYLHILRMKTGAQTNEELAARGVSLGLCLPPGCENV
ncbi:MAG: LuxR C-terminal-related transcriptional regulator [Anaerolineaceae bacterium]|nr:LuxR C-terminal-related transcriptional regulator [Anaerolineaceae bacterium]